MTREPGCLDRCSESEVSSAKTIPVFLLVVCGLLAACSSPAQSAPTTQVGPNARIYVGTGSSVQLLWARSKHVAKLPPGTLSPDGSLLFATYGSDVRGFDSITGAMTGELRLPDIYQQVAGFSPSGKYLAFAGGSGDMTWFAVAPNGLVPPARTAMLKGSFTFDALSDDGNSLFLIEHLAGANDYRVRRYDLTKGQLDPTILVEKGSLQSALMNGVRYASVPVAEYRTVYSLYYGATGAFVHALPLDGGPIVCIDIPGPRAIDPQRQAQWTLALGPGRDALYAVNAAEGYVSRIDLANSSIHSGSFSPPSAPTAWNPIVQASAKEFDAGGSAVVSPDGKTLYASALNGYVAIDTTALTLKGQYLTGDRLEGLRITPDGKWLFAVRDQDRLVRILSSSGSIDEVLLTSNEPIALMGLAAAG